MEHQTAARSSSSLRSHPDVALCCQCARTVSSLHFSLVWLVVLFVCLPVSSLLLPHNRLRFLTRPVLSQSSEGISPSFSYSYCCLSSAVSLLVSCGFVVARRISFCGFSSWLVVCRFLNPLFFFCYCPYLEQHPPPSPSFSRTPSSIQREREKKGERDSIEREENPSEFAIGKFCVRVS